MADDAVTYLKHRDGSWTVSFKYDFQEARRKHHIIAEGKKGRLWCTRCDSQCGGTIRLAVHLKECKGGNT